MRRSVIESADGGQQQRLWAYERVKNVAHPTHSRPVLHTVAVTLEQQRLSSLGKRIGVLVHDGLADFHAVLPADAIDDQVDCVTRALACRQSVEAKWLPCDGRARSSRHERTQYGAAQVVHHSQESRLAAGVRPEYSRRRKDLHRMGVARHDHVVSNSFLGVARSQQAEVELVPVRTGIRRCDRQQRARLFALLSHGRNSCRRIPLGAYLY